VVTAVALRAFREVIAGLGYGTPAYENDGEVDALQLGPLQLGPPQQGPQQLE
jgi:hypothetical protein